jgi:ribose transport system ATP-binding protein
MPAQTASATTPVVSVSQVTKTYGGVHALTGFSLDIRRGSVHAVLGENGAGKSTLMKILAGAIQPDSGHIQVDGAPVRFKSPAAADAVGIGIVYQELAVLPQRSILANLFLGSQPTRNGLVSRRRMAQIAEPVLKRMGLDLPTSLPLSALGVGEQQLVELTRLMIRRPKVLILDEPNSALNEAETQRLFTVLRELTAGGVTVVYVSHRLEEVFQIADRITVMRSGRLVWTKDRADTSQDDVVSAVVGPGSGRLFPVRETSPRPSPAAHCLSAEKVCVGQEMRDVTFNVRPGEIVGLAGLEGSGTATLLGALFGTRRITSGHVHYPDERGPVRSATQAARRGISLVPADRKRQGLMLDKSVQWNTSQVAVGAVSKRWWISKKDMQAALARQREGMSIKAHDPHVAAGTLSGGNQQKIVIGKWLEAAPRVFLLDDPTRGVDVGAKAEIYRLIRRLGDDGAIVLFRSSELPELAGLADRILIMYRGALTGELHGPDTTEEELLHAINTGAI